MNSQKIWLHGRRFYFEEWVMPSSQKTHNRGLSTHAAIFFTTGEDYALRAAYGSGGLCSANLKEGAHVLDMTNCSEQASEQYRRQVMKSYMGSRNSHVLDSQRWRHAWMTGSIMKYSAACPPLTPEEYALLKEKARQAVHEKHTPEGALAYFSLQYLTRLTIDELILAARELNYDAVIGNDMDKPPGSEKPQTYEVLFVLNPHVLTPPHWISKPVRH